MPIRPFFIFSCTLLLVTRCASYPANPPLKPVQPTAGYRLQNHIKRQGTDDRVFVILAFSAGGLILRKSEAFRRLLQELSKKT